MTNRVAIIGAGPSGMAQIRAFEPARAAGREVPDFVCFEKQANWGGQWNCYWSTGIDEHFESPHLLLPTTRSAVGLHQRAR